MQIRWWTAGSQADRAFDKSFNDVYDFAMRAVRDPNRAADVVLETMTRVRRDLRNGRVPDDVKAYAFTIAAPIVINELRDLLHVAPFGACMAEKQPIPRWSLLARVPRPGEERAARERAARAAWAEIGRLAPEDYAIVQLHLKHDLSVDYIARALRQKSEPVRARIRAVTQDLERSVRLNIVEERGRARCARLRAELGRVPDDATTEARYELVERHAEQCDRCSPELARTVGAVSVIKDFALIPASGCVKKEIRDRVNRAVEETGRSRPALRGPLRVTLALLTGTSLIGGGTAAVVRLATNPPPPRVDARSSGEPRAGSPSPTFSPRAGGGRGQVAPPGTPTVAIGLESPSIVSLRWTQPRNNGSPITGYTIERAIGSGPFVVINNTTARSYRDVVSPGRYYRYRVAAASRAGQGAFSKVKAIAVPGTLPSAPTGLVAQATNCHVLLSWSPPGSSGSGTLKGYMVSRVDKNGTTRTLTPSPITDTSYDDVWNENTGVYTYRVAAVTSVGTGPAAVSKPTTLDCIPQ